MSPTTRVLPKDYVSLRLLADRDGVQVHRARGPRGDVALRIGSAGAQSPGRSELSVLAAVEHPGLVALSDFGRDPETGDTWVARTWIEGVDLATWSRDRTPEEIGATIVELLPALQHLHECGFVHGDIKPENILVDEKGSPHLTDFGLSHRRGGDVAVSGSLFFIAPEVLGGAAPDTASDLFALGVTLHSLLTPVLVTASEFYGSFPRDDFFGATRTKVAELPEWARGIVAELVERDPTRRPSSAHQVESILRSRLGLPASKRSFDLRHRKPRWSPLAGREEWLRSQDIENSSIRVLLLPSGDDPEEFASALRLWLTLRGRSAATLDKHCVQAFDLDLNGFANELLDRSRDEILIVPIRADDHDAWRRFDYLMRSAARESAGGSGPRVLGVSVGPLPLHVDSLESRRVPDLSLDTLASLLAEEVADDVEALARDLHANIGGSLGEAQRRIRRGFARGDFVQGVRGPVLRSEAGVDSWADEPSLFDGASEPSPLDLELLAAVDARGGRCALEEARVLVDADDTDFQVSLRKLIDGAQLRWARTAERTTEVVLSSPLEDRVFAELGSERLQAIHFKLAEDLTARSSPQVRIDLARFASEPTADRLADVLDHLQKLKEAWRPELALALAEELERLARRVAPGYETRASAEVAISWAHLGQLERAEESLHALANAAGESDSARATIERARGAICHQRHDFAEAASHLARAREFDPDDGGESLYRQIQLASDRHAEAEVELLCRQAFLESEHMLHAFRWNVQAIWGVSLCRLGRLQEGLEILEGQLDEAVKNGEPAREARARLNVATALRRSGDLDRAIGHLRRAAQLQEELNHLPGLAQAHAVLGGTLRRKGALQEATHFLNACIDLRERLGDDSGATAARGMLGLVLADRGQLRDGLDELNSSARQLRATGRSSDAVILEARALEITARLNPNRPADRELGEPAADPRALVSRARAEALWGRPESARTFAERALALGTRLGQEPARAEAALVLDALSTGEAAPTAEHAASPRMKAERRAWLLASQPAAELEAQDALSQAESMGNAGFLDLAARVAMHVLTHSDDETSARAFDMARDWLGEVERGLSESETARARRTLLGLPDPELRDIDSFERALEEGGVLDMDIISLLDINQRLVAQDDLPSLLGEIVASALTVTRAERGFLVLEEDGEIKFDTARHSRRGDIVDPELEVSSSVLKRAFQRGETLRLSDAGDDPLLSGAPSVENLELRSILVTPFRIDDEMRGAIYVDHRSRIGAFSTRAQRMLELLSSQAALAIRQVRRLVEIRELNGALNRRVRDREERLAKAQQALRAAGAALPIGDLIGSSSSMQRVRAMITRVASSDLPVLVGGASGTGKELAARALHGLSSRADKPFVIENCAALPASLIESELFGYEKGAFTGADRKRSGIFERAHGGTLFLDEIGELPLDLQAKLLRVLETHELRRVGGVELVHADFRLIAATNRDLQLEVAEQRFRADLMYRLDTLRIEMPKLSERVEDIPELVEHFLDREALQSGSRRQASREVVAALGRREWPGNVRELANEVSRLCVLSPGDLDDPELIRAPAPSEAAPRGQAFPPNGVMTIAELERQAILHALEESGNDKRKAAEMLGISRAKLYQRLKAWAKEDLG